MKFNAKCKRGVLLTVAVFALCLFSVSQLGAQTDEVQLPEAKTIMDNNLKAIGMDEKFDKVQNLVTTAKMSIAAAGIEMSMTRYAGKPNKFLVKIEVPGMVEITRGSDGTVAWEMNSMTGPRLITGEEKETMMHFANFDMKNYEKRFKKMECVGVEKVGDEECYKVTLTPLKAKPYTVFYSKKSGLELKQKMTVVNQSGEIDAEHLFSDYKTIDGIKHPHKIVEKALGMESIITLTSVKQNQELPKDCFALPEEIKALLK
jgi:zinc protease